MKGQILIVMIILVLLLSACNGNNNNEKNVDMDQIVANNNAKIVETFGMFKCEDTKNVYFNAPLLINKVIAKNGQSMNKGDVILEFDDKDLDNEINIRQQSLDFAKSSLSNSRKQIPKDWDNINSMENGVEVAEYALDSIKKENELFKLDGNKLMFNMKEGIIFDLNYIYGDRIDITRKLYSVDVLDSVYVEAYVNEEFISFVKEGSTATIKPVSDKTNIYKGKVSYVSCRAVKRNDENVFYVHIDLDEKDKEILPNLNVDVVIDVK